jgi:hypothetical protein
VTITKVVVFTRKAFQLTNMVIFADIAPLTFGGFQVANQDCGKHFEFHVLTEFK